MFRKDEFRTPSPLLPSWHRVQPSDSAIMDEDFGDDFYFHSSENIASHVQQLDVKSGSHDNQVIPQEALDNQHGLPDSRGSGSRFVRTDRTVDRNTCTAAQFSDCRRLVTDRRSEFKFTL